MYSSNNLSIQALNYVKNSRLAMAQNVLKQKFIQFHGKIMRFQYFVHGQRPQNGYRLVFGLHGGGGCPFQVNQQQWNNHKHLYDKFIPPGTIWFVPRSAQQASDMWWKSYIPDLFIIIIQCFSVMNMIDNNKVFLTGYSAGGDGIYHIAGMMADFLAGAAMMAGHPNKADCYNMRNIAFSIQLGATDHAYDRANWGKVYINKIKELQNQYGGFKQYSQIHQEMGHWMDRKESKVFPKLFNQVRNPYPQFILFRQHPRIFKQTFYYTKLEEKHQGLICIRRKGNNFEIQCQQKLPIKILINQNFINFNEEVVITYNGLQTRAKCSISKELINITADYFIDPYYIFEDEIICMPGTNIPKDWKILRPYEMQEKQSAIQKIKQLQKGIVQNAELHVRFNMSDNQIIEQISQTRRIHDDQKPIQTYKNKKSHHHNGGKLKRAMQDCQNCIIY